jgi:hypothetical protein
MARHDTDSVLQQVVRAIDESGQGAAPVTVSVHGTVLAGDLIARRTFFVSWSRAIPDERAGAGFRPAGQTRRR